MKTWLAGLSALLLICCSSKEPSGDEDDAHQGDTAGDASTDAGPVNDLDANRAEHCAATFGDALKGPFGRGDGTLLAVVSPGNESCAMPNRDHVVVQMLIDGAAYRMVVNVASDRGEDRRVFVRTLEHALPEPAFAEGWHTDAPLDYVDTLGLHSTDAEWAPEDQPTLVTTIEHAVTLDAAISVYASTDGGASAHLVHRNRSGQDGALVLGPTSSAPQWLLFHFVEQSF